MLGLEERLLSSMREKSLAMALRDGSLGGRRLHPLRDSGVTGPASQRGSARGRRPEPYQPW